MMIEKTFDMLIAAGTPSRWYKWLRRLFVILCPITVPLLVVFWVVLLGTFVGMCLLGCVYCIVMEFINSMRALWADV